MNFVDFELLMKIKERELPSAQELIEDVSVIQIRTAWEIYQEEQQ